MWYAQSENKYIQDGTQFELDGITYPSQWLNQATLEQKEAIGLQEVVATNSPKSDQYYWVSTELNGAELTYVNLPKDLEQCRANDIAKVRATAYSMLLPTDWMVVKSVETSTPMDAKWSTWRASVRQATDAAVLSLEAATSVDQLAEVTVDWPKDPANEEIIVEFPVEEELV